MAIMKKALFFISISLFFAAMTPGAFAATSNWPFSTASNFTYDTNKIEVANGTARVKADFFDAAWKYRQPVTISNSGNTSALSNYQVRLKIGSGNSDFWAHIESDGASIRFTDSDKNTLLDFWLHDFDYSGKSAEIWIEVPTIEASSNKTIYFYYGNSSASSLSNGENTFLFFDDFDDNSINSTKWTEVDIAENEITETGGKLAFTRLSNDSWRKALICNTLFSRSDLSFELDYQWLVDNSSYDAIKYGWHDSGSGASDANLVYAHYNHGSASNSVLVYEDGVPRSGEIGSWVLLTDYDIRVRMRASGGAYYEQSTDGGSTWLTNYSSTYSVEGSLRPGFSFYSGTHRYDNARVRKWTSPEPDLSCGAEERGFPTDNPSIQPISSLSQTFQTVSVFSETASKEGGEIKYVLSNNQGSSWLYWNSSSSTWEASNSAYAQSNTTAEINSNIIDFPVGDGKFLFKAFLHGNSSQQVTLDNVSINYNPGSIPDIALTSPASGDANAAAAGAITVLFSHSMNQSSVQNAFSLLAIKDNADQDTSETISGAFSWNNVRSVTFTPSASLKNGYTYRATIAKTAEGSNGFSMDSAKVFTFRVVLNKDQRSIYQSGDGKAWVELGAGALTSEGYVLINRDPIDSPTKVDSNSILTADNKAIAEGNPYHYPITSSITEFNAYNASGSRITANFGAPVTLRLYYDDANNDGYVDGSSPPIKAEDLLIYRLDETNSLWVRAPGSSVNTGSKYVTAPTLHFSVYTLMSTAALNLSNAYAFPVPFKPSAGHTQITFTNLASECTIRIFTISGSLVTTILETDGDGQHTWDVANADGSPVVSGVYLYHIKSAGDAKTGKIVIIR